MSDENKIVDFSTLNEMLFGETKYIKEFAEAAIISFQEFKENYTLFLIKRDEVNLRKAGHKIKPVAQMLGLELILEEYEVAKTLIWEVKPDFELGDSSQKMNAIIDRVIRELKDIIASA